MIIDWRAVFLSGTVNATEDLLGGAPCPSCPKDDSSLSTIMYPNVVLIQLIIGLLSMFIAIFTAFKYNSVRVFHRTIRAPSISNTLWIGYFLAIFVRAGLDAIRYGLGLVTKYDDMANVGLYLSSLVMGGVVTLSLTMALGHQKKYRSASAPQTKQDNSAANAAGTTVTKSAIKAAILSWENVYILLFVVYCVFLYVQVNSTDKHSYFYYVFIAVCVLQYLPALILTYFICTSHSFSDGPTKGTKALLFFGMLLNLPQAFPMSLWAEWLPSNCVLYFAGAVDIYEILFIFSMIFFFAFLREEYQRNMEECIWTTVSQIQDTFDIRRF